MSALQWARFGSAAIEAAIKMLLLELYPGARPIDGSGGDGGRDVRWDGPDGLAIFEIKSFNEKRLSKGQRRQIEQSLARAAAHHPVCWVLVLPTDHSPAEEEWFDQLNTDHPNIRLEWRGLTWLNIEFGRREYLRRFLEGEAYEVLALARESHLEQAALSGFGDVAERASRLHARAQALSAAWSTGFMATAEGVGLSFTERFPGAGALEPAPITGFFAFPVDDVGAAAAQARLDDLLNYGGDIVIDARYVKASPSDPAAAFLESTEDADGIRIVSGTAPLGPMPSYQLVLLTTAGTVRNRLDLHAAPPTLGRRGGRLTLQDPTGTFTITMRIDLPEFGGATSVELHMRGLAGRYPYAVRTAVALFTGAESSDRIQLRADNVPIGEPNGPQLGPFAELITEGGHTVDVLAALERLQTHTGQVFPIPAAFTRAEAADVLIADKLLNGEEVRVREEHIAVAVRADRLEAFLDALPGLQGGDLRLGPGTYSATCGPHTISLGPITMRAPHATVVNTDELSAAIGTHDEPVARYYCADGLYAQLTTAV